MKVTISADALIVGKPEVGRKVWKEKFSSVCRRLLLYHLWELVIAPKKVTEFRVDDDIDKKVMVGEMLKSKQ